MNPLKIEYKKFITKKKVGMYYFSDNLNISEAYLYRFLSDYKFPDPSRPKTYNKYYKFLELMEKENSEIEKLLKDLILYYRIIKKEILEGQIQFLQIPFKKENKKSEITIPFALELKDTLYEENFRIFIDTLNKNPQALPLLIKVLDAYKETDSKCKDWIGIKLKSVD